MNATRGKRRTIFLCIVLALIGTLVSFCVFNKDTVNTVFKNITNVFKKDATTPTAKLKTLSFVGHEYANVEQFNPENDFEPYQINVFNDEDIDAMEVFYE